MARPRTPPSPEHSPDPAPARDAPQHWWHDRWLLGGLTFAALVYLPWFFAQELSFAAGSGVTRAELVFHYLLLPDEWLGGWFGDGEQAIGLLDRTPIVLLAALLLALAGAAGYAVLRAWRIAEQCDVAETTAYSLAFGLHLLALAPLLAGLAGWLHPAAIGLTLAALVGLGWGSGWLLDRAEPIAIDAPTADADGSGYVEPNTSDDATSPWPTRIVLALAAILSFILLLGAMLPPHEFDVREYHLQVPKEWFLAGQIHFLPHNVYGNMPLAAEMPALAAMTLWPGEDGWFWGALVGKTILGVWPLIGALALYSIIARLTDPGRAEHDSARGSFAGAAAATLYLALPWIGHVSMAGLNDAALAAYAILALSAILRAYDAHWTADDESEIPDHDPRAARWLILAAALAGAAASVKYTGLVLVAAPIVLLAFWSGGCWRWKGAFAAALIVLLSCGAWYAKNFAFTGNPVYPLLGSVLSGETRTPERIAQWDRVHSPQPNEHGQRFAPGQLVDSLRQLTVTGAWLSPALWPLALVGLFAGRPRGVVWIAAGWLLIFFLAWWLFSHRLERFWLPAWPAVALLAGLVVAAGRSAAWRWTATAAVAIAALYGLLLLGSPLAGDSRFFVALSDLRHDLPSDDRPGRLNPVHAWLNEHATGAVLLVGDAQAFDVARPVYYNTCFDPCLFETWTRPEVETLRALQPELARGDEAARRQAEELTQRMRRRFTERGVSHVYFHWPELARYRSPGNYGYSDFVQPEVVELLVEHNVLAAKVADLPPGRGDVHAVNSDE